MKWAIGHYPGPTSYNPLCFSNAPGLYLTPEAQLDDGIIQSYKHFWETAQLVGEEDA